MKNVYTVNICIYDVSCYEYDQRRRLLGLLNVREPPGIGVRTKES